jgi:uncharacterized membrane protein
MVGQNVLSSHAEVRADYDPEANIKAERKIEAILRHLEYQNSLLIVMLEKRWQAWGAQRMPPIVFPRL